MTAGCPAALDRGATEMATNSSPVSGAPLLATAVNNPLVAPISTGPTLPQG
jgi:hypothetical protein